jgi:hypothetical protein
MSCTSSILSYKKFYDVVMSAPGLPWSAKAVFVRLADSAKAGFRQIRGQQLQKDIGISRASVTRALSLLRSLNIIRTEQTQHALSFQIAEEKLWKTIFQGAQNEHPQGAQNEHPGGCPSIIKKDLTKKKRSIVVPAALNIPSVARERPHAAAAAAAQKPPRKPPQRITDWTPYSQEHVSDFRLMLDYWGRTCHLPPVDDRMLRDLMDLTNGAPGPDVHKVLKVLHGRGRLNNVQSWGFFPMILGSNFKARAAGNL